MTINHKTAQLYLLMAQDDALDDTQMAALDAHLLDCAACSAESEGIDGIETELRFLMKSRWPLRNSAELNSAINRLRQQLAPQPRFARTTYAPLAVGISALVILLAVAVNSIWLSTDEADPVFVMPTSTATTVTVVAELKTLTAIPSPTQTQQPNTSSPMTATIRQATRTTAPSSTPTVPIAATETPTPPLPTETNTLIPSPTLQPTPRPSPTPLSDSAQSDIWELQTAFFAALNTQSTASIDPLASDFVFYGTRLKTVQYNKADYLTLMQAEFDMQTRYTAAACSYTLQVGDTPAQGMVCTVGMTNTWREALALAPYGGQLIVIFGADNLIIHHTDFQFQPSFASDVVVINRFKAWLDARGDSADSSASRQAELLPQAADRYVRTGPANLIPLAQEWVQLGKP